MLPAIMSRTVLEAYSAYFLLGHGRSLRRLGERLGPTSPSIATLKRWSAKYGWVQLAEVNDRCQRALLTAQCGAADGEFVTDALTVAKQRFVLGVLVPRKTLKGGGRELRSEISIKDYINLLRLEHDLIKPVSLDARKRAK